MGTKEPRIITGVLINGIIVDKMPWPATFPLPKIGETVAYPKNFQSNIMLKHEVINIIYEDRCSQGKNRIVILLSQKHV